MCLYIFEILKLKSNYKNNVNIFILKIAINKKIKKNKILLSFTLLKKTKDLILLIIATYSTCQEPANARRGHQLPYNWATGTCDLPPVGARNPSSPLQEPQEHLTDDISPEPLSPAPTKTLFCFLRQFSFAAQDGPE